MTAVLRFDDPRIRDDLATYLGRAGRIEDGSLRVQELPGSTAVALWVPVLRPATLLDRSPLVVGVRAIRGRIEDAEPGDLVAGLADLTVPLRGMLDRLAREPEDEEAALRIPLPPERPLDAWTGRRPPLGGWRREAEIDSAELIRIAEEGIAEVGAATGGGLLGQVLAERARTEAWTRAIPARLVGDGAGRPPAGMAFAAHALGFLRADQPCALSIADGWWRLAAPLGQVLAQRRDEG